MDDTRYEKKQDEWRKEFESLCLRCGKCCGIGEDPCAHLVRGADGRYNCKVYEDRLGAQRTLSGKAFTCVPIGEVIKKGMPHTMCGYLRKISLSLMAFVIFWSGVAFSDGREEVEYKRFRLERATCDAAILYKETADGMDVGISAIATGKGAEFRKWRISDIKIRIGNERITPDKYDNFYAKEESLFRVPAAILFAAIGTQITTTGSTFTKGVTAAGAAIGLGLLVLAAKGEITGQKALFHMDKALADRALAGEGFAQIELEDAEQHWRDTVKIGIERPQFKSDSMEIYGKMSADELTKLIDDLGGRVTDLEKEQAAYKYGVNPEFDHIQSEIEDLQTQRGIAYRAWFTKTEKDRGR